jgi:hypothetical protein
MKYCEEDLMETLVRKYGAEPMEPGTKSKEVRESVGDPLDWHKKFGGM